MARTLILETIALDIGILKQRLEFHKRWKPNNEYLQLCEQLIDITSAGR